MDKLISEIQNAFNFRDGKFPYPAHFVNITFAVSIHSRIVYFPKQTTLREAPRIGCVYAYTENVEVLI